MFNQGDCCFDELLMAILTPIGKVFIFISSVSNSTSSLCIHTYLNIYTQWVLLTMFTMKYIYSNLLTNDLQTLLKVKIYRLKNLLTKDLKVDESPCRRTHTVWGCACVHSCILLKWWWWWSWWSWWSWWWWWWWWWWSWWFGKKIR